MNDKPVKKYTVNHYDVLNDHFTESISREKEIARSRRSKTFWTNAKSISLILFFIGVAAMFIGKAIYVAKDEKVVEKIVEVPVSQTDVPKQQDKVIINNKEVTVVTDVIKFVSLEVPLRGKSYTVNTRLNYLDVRDPFPYQHTCYVEDVFGFDAELTKKEKGRVIPHAGNQLDNLEAMGLSTSDLPYFYDYCRYL